MEETTRDPLIDPEYEADIQLKVDLMKNVHTNCLRKLTKGRENVSIPTSSKLIAIRYTGIPAAVYPTAEHKFRVSNAVKMKIRPIIEDIINEQYENKLVLPVLKHITKINDEAWLAAIERKEFTKEELSILLNDTNLPILMKTLGYRWQRLPGTDKKFITERPEYVTARYQYLKRLKQYREERRPIIYLEVFSLSEKLEAYTDIKLGGDNFVIMGISSINCLLSKNNESYLLFKNHVGEKLQPNNILYAIDTICRLTASSKDSVIIIGDDSGAAGVTSKFQIKPLNRTEMIRWLKENEIPYRKDMHKCELFDLYEKFRTKASTHHKFEAAFAEMGQLVNDRPNSCICRPKWMNNFGIFHDFWTKAKETKINNGDIMQPKGQGNRFYKLLCTRVKRARWGNFEQMLIERELKSYKRDKYVEDVIENVTIMVKENGLSEEDLTLNDFDEVPCSDDEGDQYFN